MESDIDIDQLKINDAPMWKLAYEILWTISQWVCCVSAAGLNHHDYEDVAIESIAQAINYIGKAGSFEECEHLVGTIAKNRLLDRFRQRSTQKHGAGRVESLEQQEGFDARDDSQEPPDVDLIVSVFIASLWSICIHLQRRLAFLG